MEEDSVSLAAQARASLAKVEQILSEDFATDGAEVAGNYAHGWMDRLEKLLKTNAPE